MSRANAMSAYRKQKQSQWPRILCKSCGYPKPRCKGGQNCPAVNQECNKCGKPNHFRSVCPAGGKRKLNINGIDVEIDTTDDEDDDHIRVSAL